MNDRAVGDLSLTALFFY